MVGQDVKEVHLSSATVFAQNSTGKETRQVLTVEFQDLIEQVILQIVSTDQFIPTWKKKAK
jgi:hypothetical protein